MNQKVDNSGIDAANNVIHYCAHSMLNIFIEITGGVEFDDVKEPKKNK